MKTTTIIPCQLTSAQIQEAAMYRTTVRVVMRHHIETTEARQKNAHRYSPELIAAALKHFEEVRQK